MKILFLPILCVLLMIGIIIFEQTTMEIYAYGYVINRNTREKDLNEKKINQKIYKKKIKNKSNKTLKKKMKNKSNKTLKKKMKNKSNKTLKKKMKNKSNKTLKKKMKNKSNKTSKKNLKDSTNDKLKKSSVLFFIKPVKGGITSSYFGDVVDRNACHKGHDWAVPVGTKVYGAEAGIVELAYYSESYGYNVLIKHKDNMETRYAHMSSLCVKKGDIVNKGELIGFSGNTGDSTGPHLHFEVIKEGIKVNPLKYVE